MLNKRVFTWKIENADTPSIKANKQSNMACADLIGPIGLIERVASSW